MSKKVGISAIEKIGEYKMEILNRISNSDRLSKLIAIDRSDALFSDDLSEEEKSGLLYDRIYPFRFVPEATSEARTYLTLGISGFTHLRENLKTYHDYQSGSVFFYVFTHVSLMRTDSGVRQDLLISELDRLFEGTRGLGIGELKLNGLNELWLHNNKFGGYAINYTISDLK